MITKDLKVHPKLCTQCGVCKAVCPVDAIELKQDRNYCFYPYIDMNKCTKCEMCNKSCGGNTFDISELRKQIFPNNENFIENAIGNCINTFSGYSNNLKIRKRSSSGGIVTEVLQFALEKKIIQAAVVSRINKENFFLGEGTVVYNSEDLIKTTGSKYLPIPTGEALKEIIKNNDIKRIAVVGLPCQIHSLRKAYSSIKALKNKEILSIGLFCKQTKDIRFTEFLLKKLNIKKSDVASVKFRYGSWPGSFTVFLKDGSKKSLKRGHTATSAFPWTSFCFSPIRCLLCTDATAELADISVGDPWLKEFMDEKIGTSLVIGRTKKGEQILQDACTSKAISLHAISPSKIIQSQSKKAIILKKRNWLTRYELMRIFYKDIPKVRRDNSYFSLIEYIDAAWIFCLRFITSSKLIQPFLVYAPEVVFKVLTKIRPSLRMYIRNHL